MPFNSSQEKTTAFWHTIETNRDLALTLSEHLTARDIARTAQSCKLFSSAFSTEMIWKKKCQEDFLLTENHLKAISNLTQTPDSFKKLYGALSLLKQKEFNLSAFTKYTYKRLDRLSILFACCTDQVDEAIQMIPHEERHAWLEIAISIGNPILCEKMWMKSRISQVKLLALVLKLGNYHILKSLAEMDLMDNPRGLAEKAIEYKNLPLAKQIVLKNPDANTLTIAIKTKTLKWLKKSIPPQATTSTHLLAATEANNFLMVKYLLDHNSNLINNNADWLTNLYFKYTADNFNEEMNRYLIAKFNCNEQFTRIREHNFNKAKIRHAAQCGDMHVFTLFAKQDTCLVDLEIISKVFISGNLELIRHCLSSYPTFISTTALLNACSAIGNLKIVRFIIEKPNLFNQNSIEPTDETLTLAASSGNFELVKYLTTRDHKFNLQQIDPSYFKIDPPYFKAAIRSGNLDTIFYLFEIGLPQPTLQDFINLSEDWPESESKFLAQFHRCFSKFEEAIFELRRLSKGAKANPTSPSEYLEESYREFPVFYFQLLKKYLHSQIFILSETRYLPKITHELTETDWLIILSSTRQFAQKYPHIDLGAPEWQSLFNLAKEKFMQLGYLELVKLTDEILVGLNQSLKNQNENSGLMPKLY